MQSNNDPAKPENRPHFSESLIMMIALNLDIDERSKLLELCSIAAAIESKPEPILETKPTLTTQDPTKYHTEINVKKIIAQKFDQQKLKLKQDFSDPKIYEKLSRIAPLNQFSSEKETEEQKTLQELLRKAESICKDNPTLVVDHIRDKTLDKEHRFQALIFWHTLRGEHFESEISHIVKVDLVREFYDENPEYRDRILKTDAGLRMAKRQSILGPLLEENNFAEIEKILAIHPELVNVFHKDHSLLSYAIVTGVAEYETYIKKFLACNANPMLANSDSTTPFELLLEQRKIPNDMLNIFLQNIPAEQRFKALTIAEKYPARLELIFQSPHKNLFVDALKQKIQSSKKPHLDLLHVLIKNEKVNPEIAKLIADNGIKFLKQIRSTYEANPEHRESLPHLAMQLRLCLDDLKHSIAYLNKIALVKFFSSLTQDQENIIRTGVQKTPGATNKHTKQWLEKQHKQIQQWITLVDHAASLARNTHTVTQSSSNMFKPSASPQSPKRESKHTPI